MRFFTLFYTLITYLTTTNLTYNNTIMAADADTYAGVMQRNKLASERSVSCCQWRNTRHTHATKRCPDDVQTEIAAVLVACALWLVPASSRALGRELRMGGR